MLRMRREQHKALLIWGNTIWKLLLPSPPHWPQVTPMAGCTFAPSLVSPLPWELIHQVRPGSCAGIAASHMLFPLSSQVHGHAAGEMNIPSRRNRGQCPWYHPALLLLVPGVIGQSRGRAWQHLLSVLQGIMEWEQGAVCFCFRGAVSSHKTTFTALNQVCFRKQTKSHQGWIPSQY